MSFRFFLITRFLCDQQYSGKVLFILAKIWEKLRQGPEEEKIWFEEIIVNYMDELEGESGTGDRFRFPRIRQSPVFMDILASM